MTVTYNNHDLISSNTSQITAPLSSLITDFGDALEWLTAIEKLRLLGILAIWQDINADFSASGYDPVFTIADAIERHGESISANLKQAIESLDGLTPTSCFDLMVAIANQIKDRIYQQ